MTQIVNIEDFKPTPEMIAQLSERLDGWQNIITGLGARGKDHSIEAKHVLRAPIGDDENDTMYVQNQLYAKIVDAIPEHAIRRWITYTGKREKFNAEMQAAHEDLDTQSKLFELMKLERQHGGSAMILGANDGQLPNAELDFNNIQSVEYLNVYSCRELQAGPRDDDPLSKYFGQPEFFYFAKWGEGDERRRIHPSRVIALRGIQVGGTTSRYKFWGYPILERVYDSIRRFDTIYGYLEALFKDLATGVMKIKDLAGLIATTGGNELLLKRLALVNMASSMFNAILIDGEEEFDRKEMSFSGVRDAIVSVMDELAAQAEMPLSILFGQPPAGLSTDDSGGRTAFYDSIANKQRKLLREPLNRISRALILAKSGPTKGREPRDWFFSFNPLMEPDENQKATRQLRLIEGDKALVELQIISAREARSRLENDPDCPYVLDPEYSAALDALQENDAEDMVNPPEPQISLNENGEPNPEVPPNPNGAQAPVVNKKKPPVIKK